MYFKCYACDRDDVKMCRIIFRGSLSCEKMFDTMFEATFYRFKNDKTEKIGSCCAMFHDFFKIFLEKSWLLTMLIRVFFICTMSMKSTASDIP